MSEPRAIVFDVEAWDINGPQHIHKRLSQRQISAVIAELQARIADLEQQLEQFGAYKIINKIS